jgi:hypothetical protein
MNPLPLLQLAPFALLLPGLALIALLRLPVGCGRTRTDLADLMLTSIVLSIAFNAWAALTLAEVGLFGLPALALIWLALGGAAAYVAWRRRAWPFGSVRLSGWSLAIGVVFALGAALVSRPAEYVFGIYDPGVYVNVGVAMARTGGVLVPDPELPRLTPDERRALFGNVPAPWHRSGMPFVTVHDASRGTLEAEWFHLFPAWLAIWALAGNPLWGTPLLYLGALGAMALLGRVLVHPAVGLAAALFLAVNVGEIWFGRYPMADLMAQTLVLTGFALLGFSATRRSAAFAALAGATFGLVHLAKIDIVIVPLALGGALAWQWLRGRWGRCETALLVGYLAVGGQAFLHALIFARFYILRIVLDLLTVSRLRPLLDLSALDRANLDHPYALDQLALLALANWWLFALPAAVFLVALLALLRLRGRLAWLRIPESPRLNLVLAAVTVGLSVWAFFLRPVSLVPLPEDPLARAIAIANQQSFVQLGWYFTPLGLAVAVAGLVGILIARPHPVLVLFALAGALSAFQLLGQALVNPGHFWAFRRFLPVVVPAFSLGMAYLLSSLGERGASWRAHLPGGALGLLLAGMMLWQAAPILGETEYGGARRQFDTFVASLPQNAVILFAWSPAAERLATPLHFAYGRTVFAVEDASWNDPGFIAARRRWDAEGRPVLYLREHGLPPGPIEGPPSASVRIDVPALERPLDRLPREWERLRLSLDLYRLERP